MAEHTHHIPHHAMTPLSDEDIFTLINFDSANSGESTLHWHQDFELNMFIDCCGERLVGDSVERFSGLDMVLVGPGLKHMWKCDPRERGKMITIQFHGKSMRYPTVNKRAFSSIKSMLERSKQGISFPEEVKEEANERIRTICASKGFDSTLQFFSLFDFLSRSPNNKLLASSDYVPESAIRHEADSMRIGKVRDYVEENYARELRLADVAALTGMSESAFCHFYKKRTGRNFVDFLNDVRISHAARKLYDTDSSISDIGRSCGFNNTSNFIRVFKQKRGQTPSHYRDQARNVITKY